MEKPMNSVSDNIDLIGSCGISCGQCACRVATITNDLEKKKEVAEKWSVIYNATITAEMISCTGCQMPGDKFIFPATECTVRPCVISRKLKTCADCTEYPCPKIDELHAHSPKARKKIEQLREEKI